ncbi:MAG: 4Fe-4S binding protein [Thermoplasmata archaeon]
MYICHCGGNISDYVDVKKVKEKLEGTPGVALIKTMMFTCSDSSQQEIISDIKEKGLDAVVIASCSPKLHQFTFRNVAKRAGLNQYKYVQANIREQVSWAHSNDPKGATEKAISVIRGAISRAREAEALEPIGIQSSRSVLIIGGGVSGLRSALEFSKIGVNVYLIEKSPFLGGRLMQWAQLFPSGESGRNVAGKLVEDVTRRENITVMTNAQLIEKAGCVGNFSVKIKIWPRGVVKRSDKFQEAIQKCPVEYEDEYEFGIGKRKAIFLREGSYPGLPAIDFEKCTRCGECAKICGDAVDLQQREEVIELNVGAIVVATGFDPYTPKSGEFGYGKFKRVITLPMLERYLSHSTGKGRLIIDGREIKSAAFIYCVGSRQHREEGKDVNEYCSRYCCTSSIFVSLHLKKDYPHLNIYHLFRDIRTYGKNELYYEDASRRGVVFVKYDEDDPPTVTSDGDSLMVSVTDLLTDRERLEIPVDLVVLVTGMVPRENGSLTQILKIPTGRDRFFNEVHPKLKPVETTIAGIYLAGTSQGPKNTQESISSALSAVSKASSLLMKGKIELEPNVAHVNEEICEWCGKCAEACPYDAIRKVQINGKEVATIEEGICKGCGACVPYCPVNAIQVLGYSDKEIMAEIDAMAAKEVE